MFSPPQGRLHENFNVVGDEHQVPGLKLPVHPAGGVGDKEGVAPQQAEHPDPVAHLLIGVSLVVVDPTLHHGHRLAGQAAEDQLSFVSRGGGMFKMGNLPVGDHHGVLHQVPQIPQAGAQNHGHLGPEPSQLGLQSVRAFPILGKGIIHSISSISGPRPCFFPGPRPGFPSSILGYLTPTARKNQIKSLALQGFFSLGRGPGRDFSPAPPLSRQNRRAAVFLLAISCQSVL